MNEGTVVLTGHKKAKAKSEWLQRLQAEIDALQEKITLLEAFLHSPAYQTLDLVQQTLLDTQLNIMDSYANILAARIRAAGGL
jgi:hypothetical protein